MTNHNLLSLQKNKETIVQFLQGIALFDELSADELKIVVDYMNLFEFDAGQVLFSEGDTGDYVCFVADGVVDVKKKSVTGSDVLISTLSKGSAIGEMAVIDKIPRSATVVARKKTQLVVLGQNGFRLILDKNPHIGNKILIGIARRLSANLRRTSNQLNAFNHLLVTISKQTGHKMPESVEEYTTVESQDAIREEEEVGESGGVRGVMDRLKKNFGLSSSRRKR